MSTTYKIFLCVQPSSLELARYIDNYIEDINRTGVKIQIEKITAGEIDDDMKTMLSRKGISRMPAMIDPTGRVSIGLRQIKSIFEKRMGRAAMDSRFSPAMESGAGVSPDLPNDVATYWQRELFSGADIKGGKITFNDERNNNDDTLHDDIHKKIADQQRRAAHRRGQNNRDSPLDDEPRQPTRVSASEMPQDNIRIDDDGGAGFTRREPANSIDMPDLGGDAVDEQMLKAWMQNNIS